MSLEGADDREKLTSLCKKPYKEQAIWFLNATWEGQGQAESENFWKYVHKCADLDLQRKATGYELDELNMHRFLAHFKNKRSTCLNPRAVLSRSKAHILYLLLYSLLCLSVVFTWIVEEMID